MTYFNIDKFERAAEAHFDRMLNEYLDQGYCRGCEDTPLNESCEICGYGTYEIPCMHCGSKVEVDFDSEPDEEDLSRHADEVECQTCRDKEWLSERTFAVFNTRFVELRLPTRYVAFDEQGRWVGAFKDPEVTVIPYTPVYVGSTRQHEAFSTDLYTGWGIGRVPKGVNIAVGKHLERLRDKEQQERNMREASR